MEKTVKVTCLNNGQDYDIPMGSNLSEALQLMNLTMEHEPILAHVNNKVEGMHYRIYKPKRVHLGIGPACLHAHPVFHPL